MWDGRFFFISEMLVGLFVLFLNLIVVGVVVWLVVLLVRRSPGPPGRSHALKVLEERYAKGEIERDDYFERRRVLLGSAEGARPEG